MCVFAKHFIADGVSVLPKSDSILLLYYYTAASLYDTEKKNTLNTIGVVQFD